MLAVQDILLKHEIIKTMNPRIINTTAELHGSTTEQVSFSREGVPVKRTWANDSEWAELGAICPCLF